MPRSRFVLVAIWWMNSYLFLYRWKHRTSRASLINKVSHNFKPMFHNSRSKHGHQSWNRRYKKRKKLSHNLIIRKRYNIMQRLMFYNARLSVLNILLDMSRVPNECLYGCFASVSPLLDKVHVWDWSVWGTWCIYVIHEGLWCPHINCLWAFIGVYRNLDLTNYFWASFLNAFKNSNNMFFEESGAPVVMRMW